MSPGPRIWNLKNEVPNSGSKFEFWPFHSNFANIERIGSSWSKKMTDNVAETITGISAELEMGSELVGRSVPVKMPAVPLTTEA